MNDCLNTVAMTKDTAPVESQGVGQVVNPFSSEEVVPMGRIYQVEGGPAVVGAWGKDVGTMERRLMLAMVYPNDEVTPIREYSKRKLADYKALLDLTDLEGINSESVKEIYRSVVENAKTMEVQQACSGKCSLKQAYEQLCEYVEQYEEPSKVFVKDGYGNILATYLNTVLDKLELGYTRLELERNFKGWGLLRANTGTGHIYVYKINTGAVNDWFFSFRLPSKGVAA